MGGDIVKTITFALQKGGTGKTSVSVAVALELAKNHKVIFIDADPQGNASDWIGPDIIDIIPLEDLPSFMEDLTASGYKGLSINPEGFYPRSLYEKYGWTFDD